MVAVLSAGSVPTRTPALARGSVSVVEGRAHAVQAKPYGWLADSPAWTAPTLPLAFQMPPGQKNGLGKGQG
jgi:hypothetical protein